jgi:hypothetical protein
MVGNAWNSDCDISALKSSFAEGFTDVGSISRSLSPTPRTPPVEITTCEILPDDPSTIKSWSLPSSSPPEPRSFFPFRSATEDSSASSVARLTLASAIIDAAEVWPAVAAVDRVVDCAPLVDVDAPLEASRPEDEDGDE